MFSFSSCWSSPRLAPTTTSTWRRVEKGQAKKMLSFIPRSWPGTGGTRRAQFAVDLFLSKTRPLAVVRRSGRGRERESECNNNLSVFLHQFMTTIVVFLARACTRRVVICPFRGGGPNSGWDGVRARRDQLLLLHVCPRSRLSEVREGIGAGCWG